MAMNKRWTTAVIAMYHEASKHAQRCNHTRVSSLMVLHGLCRLDSKSVAVMIFADEGKGPRSIALKIDDHVQSGAVMQPRAPQFSHCVNAIFALAETIADAFGHKQIGSGHMLLALICFEETDAYKLLAEIGLTADLREKVEELEAANAS